ncbi:MAG: LuxR C-terminal-related transcriptional regulator [Butyricimonas faecihominis]
MNHDPRQIPKPYWLTSLTSYRKEVNKWSRAISRIKKYQIAKELGISARTVETILYQAMKKLRAKAKK